MHIWRCSYICLSRNNSVNLKNLFHHLCSTSLNFCRYIFFKRATNSSSGTFVSTRSSFPDFRLYFLPYLIHVTSYYVTIFVEWVIITPWFRSLQIDPQKQYKYKTWFLLLCFVLGASILVRVNFNSDHLFLNIIRTVHLKFVIWDFVFILSKFS